MLFHPCLAQPMDKFSWLHVPFSLHWPPCSTSKLFALTYALIFLLIQLLFLILHHASFSFFLLKLLRGRQVCSLCRVEWGGWRPKLSLPWQERDSSQHFRGINFHPELKTSPARGLGIDSRNRVYNWVDHCPWNINLKRWNRLFIYYMCQSVPT